MLKYLPHCLNGFLKFQVSSCFWRHLSLDSGTKKQFSTNKSFQNLNFALENYKLKKYERQCRMDLDLNPTCVKCERDYLWTVIIHIPQQGIYCSRKETGSIGFWNRIQCTCLFPNEEIDIDFPASDVHNSLKLLQNLETLYSLIQNDTNKFPCLLILRPFLWNIINFSFPMIYQ